MKRYILFLSLTTVFGYVPLSIAENPVNDRLFRVGSKTFTVQDCKAPEADVQSFKAKYTPEQFEKWLTWYNSQLAVSKLMGQAVQTFCEKAECTPDEVYVTEWNSFLEDQIRNMHGRLQEAIPADMDPEAIKRTEGMFGGPPPNWQTSKALYQQYGGRVYLGNLGYYQPVEATMRLVKDMEAKGELEIFDPALREKLQESFNNQLTGSTEIDETYRAKEGMADPWEFPFWSRENRLFSATKHLAYGQAASFKADKANKRVTYFDKSGNRVIEEFIDQDRNLVLEKYTPDGSLESVRKTIRKENRDVTQFFDKDGALTRENYFLGGEIVATTYDKNGKVLSETREKIK